MDKTPHPDHNPLDQFVTNINRDKEEELAATKAAGLGLAYKNMLGFQPDPSAVSLVPKELATDGRVFAFEKQGSDIGLAIADPTNPQTLIALKHLASLDQFTFKPVFVSQSSMDYLLALYDTFAPKTAGGTDTTVDQSLAVALSDIKNLAELEKRLAGASTSDSLDLVLAGAIGLKASDIHIEPGSDSVRLRYRLDGVLQDAAAIPTSQLDALTDRIKLTASLKLNQHEIAQDGRFSITVGEDSYDLRVSVLPTQYGESTVLRLLPQKGHFVDLADLGFSGDDLSIIKQAIGQPNGLILNTGPTGSGKTTTLYAILAQLNQSERKIITVEDPIEYRLDGITQTQVNTEEDYSFANALRAIVRQDPDVILVGEIRDTDTAEVAINASLTGHLVLSTLHTNDAAGAIPRLVDLGAKPNVFADALKLIIAQRLIRKLCPQCKQAHPITEAEVAELKKLSETATLPSQLYSAVGCDQCNGTGYSGRLAIYELLSVTPEIRQMIATTAPAHDITKLAIQQGMVPLGTSGIAKLSEGITSLEELARVVEATD